MKQGERYKAMTIELIRKTNNPVTPIALQGLMDGIESTAKCIAPNCKRENVDALSARLLKDFSDDELNNQVGKSPEFLLVLLAHTKETALRYALQDMP